MHRLVLAAGAAALGTLSLLGLVVVLALASGDPRARIVIDDQTVPPGTRPPALLAASVGETVVGVLLLLSAVALLLGRDRFGLRAGHAGLVFGLAAVNVVIGYISAETVVVLVVAELALLGLFRRYRTRFPVNPHAEPQTPAPLPPRADSPAASSWPGLASGR